MLKKRIKGILKNDGDKIADKLYKAIQSIRKMGNQYASVDIYIDMYCNCSDDEKANKLLSKNATKEEWESFLSSILEENEEVEIILTYYIENEDKYMGDRNFAIGDKVVFATTAVKNKIMAYGQIVDKNDDGDYKIDVISNRNHPWSYGNKESRDAVYRWVPEKKLFKADMVEEVLLDSLEIGDTVLANIDNDTVCSVVSSKKKTVRTNFNTTLTDSNFYKLK